MKGFVHVEIMKPVRTKVMETNGGYSEIFDVATHDGGLCVAHICPLK